MDFELDNQLKRDCHLLLEWEEIIFLLNKNATIPWLILVPKTNKQEFLDLSKIMSDNVLLASKVIQDFFKNNLNMEKINYASIGNVVSQLHIHIVGRRKDDAIWPNLVWGRRYQNSVYSVDQIKNIIKHLQLQLT